MISVNSHECCFVARCCRVMHDKPFRFVYFLIIYLFLGFFNPTYQQKITALFVKQIYCVIKLRPNTKKNSKIGQINFAISIQIRFAVS